LRREIAEGGDGAATKTHGRKASKIPRVAVLGSTPRGTPRAKDLAAESPPAPSDTTPPLLLLPPQYRNYR